MFEASIDHVVPWALGGETELDNLVAACWCCNFGKSNFTVEALGIEDPRLRAPVLTGWRGLTTVTAGART